MLVNQNQKNIPRDGDVAFGGDDIGNAVEEHVEGSIAPQPQLRLNDPLQNVDGAELFELEQFWRRRATHKYLVKRLTYDDEASNSWITAGMFCGDVAKALRNKFDEDFEADQQRKKARRRLVSEEHC